MQQFVITPQAGKRLIAKALAAQRAVREAAAGGTLVIVAGTTNAYVAQEVLATMGLAQDFSMRGFHRGWTLAPGADAAALAADFTGDVVISKGQWLRGKQIFDVAETLTGADVILKGANALDVDRRQAAVQVGHPQCGTAAECVKAAVGRRVRMIVPIGLEKRVPGDLHALAQAVNDPSSQGPRLLPLPGLAFCELDAVELLTGASTCITAAGGVYGAEGCVWLGISGSGDQQRAAAELIRSIEKEPPTPA
jgi:hypothetical protein